MCACGVKTEAPAEEAPAAEKTGENIANPVQEATVESLINDMGVDFSAFEQFENAAYSMISGSSRIGQADYSFEGDEYNARIASLAAEEDISGMHYTWTETSEAEVGYCTASVNLTAEGQGVISWFDVVPGMMYTVSMSKNATADKLIAMANRVFVPVQGDSNGDFDLSFNAILDEMIASYRPGTAGSSINAFSVAAHMADFFTEMNPTAGEVSEVVAGYMSGLSDDEKASFPERINGIVGAYRELAANGTGPLADGEYEAISYPWPDTVAPLFDAMENVVK